MTTKQFTLKMLRIIFAAFPIYLWIYLYFGEYLFEYTKADFVWLGLITAASWALCIAVSLDKMFPKKSNFGKL